MATKLRLSFPVIAAVGVMAAVALILATKDYSGDQLRRLGGATADSLDAYTRTHHGCPASLEAIGLTAPDTKYGPFTYTVWERGARCTLSVGVYARDGFEEYWMYPPGDWYSNR